MSVFIYVYVCGYLFVRVFLKVSRGCQIPLELKLQVVVSQPTRVLGIALGL